MLSWLRRFLSNPVGTTAAAAKDLITVTTTALAGLLDTIFGHVGSAWADLAKVLGDAESINGQWERAVYARMREVITHWIPRYALTAWWWATHPSALAKAMFWYLIRELEDNAAAASRYLGGWLLSLLLRQTRVVVAALEAILAAVL